MDGLAQYNKERWEELAGKGIAYSLPALNLDCQSARELLDPYGVMGEVNGKKVLCLASGGGQQSAAFGILGAQVTVLDLSETQLERDREAAVHYCLQIDVQQGDMRDLSRFEAGCFEIVFQAYSINFVPNARQVIREVRKILKPGGLYRVDFHNPFTQGLDERDWTGEGYVHKLLFVDGAEIKWADPDWEIWDENGGCIRVRGPRAFRHALSTIINTLVGLGFVILGFWEGPPLEGQPEPGSWDHYLQVAQPYCAIWARG